MSHAGVSCPDCGSSNLVDDNLYCQVQRVCVDCGSVVSEGALTSELTYLGGSDVSYSRTTACVKKPCLNQIKGVQRVKDICRIFRLNCGIEDLSQTYFNQAYRHESFIKVRLEKKEILAGCCVLISCRMLNWPITIQTLCCLLDADPVSVGGVYQEMVKALDIKAPLLNITDVIESHCHEYKLSSLHVPEELSETSKDLSKRAVELVELAADAWIVTGRTPVPIMMAAIYLSWQSLKPNRQRLKFSLDKFCQVSKVNKHNPALKRVLEMKKVLCKLGNEIPWVGATVTPDNVVLWMDDILKHRFALLRKALRIHEGTLLAECRASGEDSLTEETPPPKVSELDAGMAQRPADGDDNACSAPEPHSDAQESPDPEPNWGKRVLFAPPCVIHPKKRRTEQPEVRDVTGDEDISDSEIESYIRSPREAQEFALAKKKLFKERQIGSRPDSNKDKRY